MTQYVIEADGKDHRGRKVPRLIGTFNTHVDATTFADAIIASGSWAIVSLTGPAFARALASQPPEETLDPDFTAWQHRMREDHPCDQEKCTHVFND